MDSILEKAAVKRAQAAFDKHGISGKIKILSDSARTAAEAAAGLGIEVGQIASAFAGIATQYRDNQQTGPATIIGSADIYVSDFGQHQIVANRFMPSNQVYCLDMEYWSVAYLRPIQNVELAKTGDSDRSMILTECTVIADNPKASAKVYAVTTS